DQILTRLTLSPYPTLFRSRQMEESVNFLSGLKTRQAEINTEIQRLKTLTADQLLASPAAKAPQTGNAQGGQPDSALGGELVQMRSEEHTSELQSLRHLVCR